MEKIAFFWGVGVPVFWRTVLIALGAFAFIFLLIALRLLQGRKLLPVLVALLVGAAAAIYSGRIIHWYCLSENYPSFGAALGDLGTGSFSLVGVFIGAFLAAALLRLVGAERDSRGLLDDLALSGALGIAAGRLGEFFGSADRAKFFVDNPLYHRLPFSAAVIHPVSGAEEWRFATFCAQSLWAFLLFASLAARLLRLRRTDEETRARTVGRGFVLFLELYCLGQILLDSTRYDALFLPINGFVSLEQILSCAVLAAILTAESVRAIRAGGLGAHCALCWFLFLGGLGLAGYMEYYVQRHGGTYVFSYLLMSLGLGITFISLRLMAALGRKTLPADTVPSR